MLQRIPSLAFIVAAFIPLLVLACGGSDDDKPGKTPANCAAICAQQNRLCGSKDDCDAQCSNVAQVVSKTGCDAEMQQGYDCLSEKNVCDDDETACPGTEFFACFDAYCAQNAADAICAP